MGSQGDTDFLITSDWNANNEASLPQNPNGPEGDLEASGGSEPSKPSREDARTTPTASAVTTVTFADVTPNKQRLPPPSELTPPPSLPSTPQKKFACSSDGESRSDIRW